MAKTVPYGANSRQEATERIQKVSDSPVAADGTPDPNKFVTEVKKRGGSRDFKATAAPDLF